MLIKKVIIIVVLLTIARWSVCQSIRLEQNEDYVYYIKEDAKVDSVCINVLGFFASEKASSVLYEEHLFVLNFASRINANYILSIIEYDLNNFDSLEIINRYNIGSLKGKEVFRYHVRLQNEEVVFLFDKKVVRRCSLKGGLQQVKKEFSNFYKDCQPLYIRANNFSNYYYTCAVILIVSLLFLFFYLKNKNPTTVSVPNKKR